MQKKLAEYANLIVRVGVNLQPGQTIVINCPVECAEFGRMVAAEAYRAGAREVVVRWIDDAITRMKYLEADDAVFDEVPEWFKMFYKEQADKQAAFVQIAASDPENLKGVSPDRIKRNVVASGAALKDYQDKLMANEFPWCIVSIPTAAWAAKIFPEIPAGDAQAKLWDAILETMRVGTPGGGTAAEKWAEHLSRLNKRADMMNDYRFKRLIFRNKLGTDISVELPDGHLWLHGGEKAKTGVNFVANMPTEEIFTAPLKTGVEGVLCSSMPFVLNGNLVKDVKFTIKKGKIEGVEASEGLDHLLKQLDADEGARYFGEVALVPYNSVISNQKILYYNTLFDENASCHFAFGRAIPTLEGAQNMTAEETEARGLNNSIIHVDFMVGTPDLSVTGITPDGREIRVLTEGNFAF